METISVEIIELIERSSLRRNILRFLAEQSLPSYVNQIAREVETSSRNVSSALRVLEKLGLVEPVKEGDKKSLRMKFWRITPQGMDISKTLKIISEKSSLEEEEKDKAFTGDNLRISPGKTIDIFGDKRESPPPKEKKVDQIDFSKILTRYDLKEGEKREKRSRSIDFSKILTRYQLREGEKEGKKEKAEK